MTAAVGAMLLPALLPTSVMTALGTAGPLLAGALGGGIGNAVAGDDFWKGTLGGLAGGAFDLAAPGITNALGGSLGDMAPIATNALRGSVMSGAGGGDVLQGAALGGLMGTQPMQQMAAQGTNALRSMAGLSPVGDPAQAVGGGQSSTWANAFGGDTQMANQAASGIMGQDPGQAVNMAGWGNPQQSPMGNYLSGFLDPKVLVPAAAQVGMGLYNTMAQEDMADRQLELAREMDTGLGMRKQAAGYAMNPNSIPGSPGYQAALNERRRQLMRLQSAKGGLHGGALPRQLADSADKLLGDWYGYYSGTANRASNVPYPNYQNMLRTA